MHFFQPLIGTQEVELDIELPETVLQEKDQPSQNHVSQTFILIEDVKPEQIEQFLSQDTVTPKSEKVPESETDDLTEEANVQAPLILIGDTKPEQIGQSVSQEIVTPKSEEMPEVKPDDLTQEVEEQDPEIVKKSEVREEPYEDILEKGIDEAADVIEEQKQKPYDPVEDTGGEFYDDEEQTQIYSIIVVPAHKHVDTSSEYEESSLETITELSEPQDDGLNQAHSSEGTTSLIELSYDKIEWVEEPTHEHELDRFAEELVKTAIQSSVIQVEYEIDEYAHELVTEALVSALKQLRQERESEETMAPIPLMMMSSSELEVSDDAHDTDIEQTVDENMKSLEPKLEQNELSLDYELEQAKHARDSQKGEEDLKKQAAEIVNEVVNNSIKLADDACVEDYVSLHVSH